MLNHVYINCTDICIHIYVHKYINTQAFFSLFFKNEVLPMWCQTYVSWVIPPNTDLSVVVYFVDEITTWPVSDSVMQEVLPNQLKAWKSRAGTASFNPAGYPPGHPCGFWTRPASSYRCESESRNKSLNICPYPFCFSTWVLTDTTHSSHFAF